MDTFNRICTIILFILLLPFMAIIMFLDWLDGAEYG
jgi:hypothetical protein